MDTRYCEKCGRLRVVGERFCRQCGSQFAEKSPPPKPKVFCSLCGNRVEGTVCSNCGTVAPAKEPVHIDIKQIMGGDARKVVGLLAKADDTSFPEESATALRVATDICSKYDITIEQFQEWAKRELSRSE